MKIEDLIPERAEFTLKSTGRSYTMRPVSLDDEVWMQRAYGQELQKIFQEPRLREICRIAYRLIEDKSDFVTRTVKIISEEGQQTEEHLGGVDLFLRMIVGIHEKQAIMEALAKTIGVSRPMIDKIENEMLSAQKKTKQKKKPIGLKSSIR